MTSAYVIVSWWTQKMEGRSHGRLSPCCVAGTEGVAQCQCDHCLNFQCCLKLMRGMSSKSVKVGAATDSLPLWNSKSQKGRSCRWWSLKLPWQALQEIVPLVPSDGADSQQVTACPAPLLSILIQSARLTGVKERSWLKTFDMALDRRTDLQIQSTGKTESYCNGLQMSLETRAWGTRRECGWSWVGE